MREFNYRSQSAVAVNSAVAKMFAKVSVEQVVDKLVNKVNKTKEKKGNILANGSISIKVSEDFKIKIDYHVVEYFYQMDLNIYRKNIEGKYFKWDDACLRYLNETELYEKLSDAICKILERTLSFAEERIIKYENRKDMEHIRTKSIESWNDLTGLDYLEFNKVA
jgi:hypothetical protein